MGCAPSSFHCFLCKEKVTEDTFDAHRSICAQENEWYIDQLPKSEVRNCVNHVSQQCFNSENQHGLFLTCLYFPPNQVKCPHCKTRNLRLWPPSPDIQLACSDPTCRVLGDGAYMKSDGKNTYMCFHCCFILCTRCVELYFGRTSLQQGNFLVDIGDEVLKLPPTYSESCVLQMHPLPSYEVCTSV